jgi:exosortase
VQSPAASLAPAETSTLSIRYFSARLVLPFLFFGALWFILCRQLSVEWSVNEQYNYGWFVPFFALYLFWLRWQDLPAPDVRNQKSEVRSRALLASAVGIVSLFLLLPVRLFEIGTPEWRPLGWIHTASVAALTLLYIWSVGGLPWLRHFAFPIAFFFVAVPWVTPIEAPVIQGLMRAVAGVAAETITLFGIPAQLEGNLIRLTSGLVGVNEACSGVRSLQTSLMIGLLFGELKRLSIWRRVALVSSAVAIALFANFFRAILLVWLAATKNISEIGRWHDIAGYTIVGLVFLGTLILATLLGRKKGQGRAKIEDENIKPAASNIEHPVSHSALPALFLVLAFCWIIAIEVSVHRWYSAHENNLVATTRWGVRWPETAPNFHRLKIDDEVRRVLRFDEGEAAVWTLPAAPSPAAIGQSKPHTITCLLYLFRWKPGRNSVLLANLHRPDVCLPAIGWTQVADTGVRNYPVTSSFALPFRHFEFRHGTPEDSAPQIAHAFYCLWEDRASSPSAAGSNLPQMATAPSTWTRDERIRQVLEGRRHLGQQVMEVVFVSSEPMSAAAAEASLADLVRNLVLLRPISAGL